ncbi:hypothetical protein ANN_12823 [Periplaneta americana]|uniref:Uncharacterized protein n=1 Tax=Periplaneta americana TaxID=6978 RepID=A0ABQ8TJN1_PERAM|nr:hypothetical protein ANN_12823 [Periplaneta americana]
MEPTRVSGTVTIEDQRSNLHVVKPQKSTAERSLCKCNVPRSDVVSTASCLGPALRNARWFESSWRKKFSHEIWASVWNRTDRLDTATCTHTLLSTDVHIRTDHVRYTLRYLHCFSVVSCPHLSDSVLNGILRKQR